MPGTGLIDVHAHFTTKAYIAAAKAVGHVRPDGMPEQYWPRWTACDHLDLLDRAGIQKAILSISSPGVHFGDDAVARALAIDVNDAAAAIVHAHPERFGFFASLPAPDVEGALRELPRALDELGAAGIVLMTNSRGRYLGDGRFAPLLAELDQRAAVVLLHPTSTEHHEVVDLGRPRPMLEFLFDTARTVIDYILAGNAQRYPAIKLVVPHAGGVLPLLAERVELFRSVVLGEPAGRLAVSDLLARCYFDLAGPANQTQLNALTTVAPIDRLVYGSDYAWTPAEVALRALAGLDKLLRLDKPWREVTSANAKTLLAIA
jgi:predicted TIM-barrel fold metal-dependent hydrolase